MGCSVLKFVQIIWQFLIRTRVSLHVNVCIGVDSTMYEGCSLYKLVALSDTVSRNEDA